MDATDVMADAMDAITDVMADAMDAIMFAIHVGIPDVTDMGMDITIVDAAAMNLHGETHPLLHRHHLQKQNARRNISLNAKNAAKANLNVNVKLKKLKYASNARKIVANVTKNIRCGYA